MAESIRFDFLSTGADRLAKDFKNTGDNAAAAARGAKVLQDVIDRLGQKEGRTAAESRLLADALRKTGDAEDRAAAKALRAEIAIARLDEELQKNERDALKAAAANDVLGHSFDNLAKRAGGPSLKGALLALSPALIPATAGIAAGIGAVGASFGAAAVGAGLFGAAAKSVLSGASTDLQKLQALELKANTARTAAQKKAAQQQITALKSSWSGGYLSMIGALDDFKTKWKSTSQQIAVPALTAWIHVLSDAIGFLKPALQPVADLFTSWGKSIDRYFKSSAGSAEVTRLAAAFGRFSASQLRDIGVFVTDVGKAVFNLGRDLAGHNVDFGTFGKHLDEWGAAFLRWSQSNAARQDVNKFLAYLQANGPVVSGLLKNLGSALAVFAPGLSGLGQLELKLVSDFLGVLARTPKFIAQPLIETAGALLLLQKTGVLSIGIKVVGAAAKWLSGGVISLGSGATAAAEIRAAFTSGGAAAAAEIRAALASGGAALGGEIAAGSAAAGSAVGEAAATSLAAALGPAVLGISMGAAIALWVNQFRTAVNQHPAPAGQLGPRGPRQDDINAWKRYDKAITDTGNASDLAKAKLGSFAGLMHDRVNTSLASAGTHADALRISHLGPLGSKVDSVTHQTAIMQGVISNPQHLAVGGQHADAFRNAHLEPLRSKVQSVDHQTQLMQGTINNLHGKQIDVGVHGSGSGGAKITVSSVGGGPFAGKLVAISNRALGGFIDGGTPGKDSVPAMLMPGEVVVPTRMVRAGAVDHLRGRLPGFAAGGLVNPTPFVTGTEGSYGADSKNAIGALASAAFKAVVTSVANELKAQQGGSGQAVLNYAKQYVGKVPYVWGGSTPSGWDCSGFVSWVYDHLGLFRGRTTAAGFQSWARPSGPVPGGLAFYGSPAHHVGFVTSDGRLMSALGRKWGTTISSLGMGDNSGYGVPPQGFGGGGGASPTGSKLKELAYSMLANRGWAGQWAAFNSLETREAGWNMTARNPSSGAYGLAQFIQGPREYYTYGGNPNTAQGQLTAMLNYIAQRYGNPNNAWAHEIADNWYGKGGLVPGFASGGTVASKGRAWLNAWQHRSGGGYGAAWGPVVVNEQIARMAAAVSRAKTLASAPGLTGGQHKTWAATAADETKRLGVLKSELTTERAWRSQLGVNELALDREIRAAGNIKSLAGPVKRWKAQLAGDKATVSAISKMLGYSDAYIKAHPAKAPPPKLPPVTHTYGGDVANTIAPILASALSPVTMDRGGWLSPGLTTVYNGTGRPEAVVPPRRGGGGAVVLEVESSGTEFDQFLTAWLRKHTRVKGGGDVQVAWGSR